MDNYKKHCRLIHGYSSEVPAPTILNYNPRQIAKTPVIKRPWEVCTIKPGQIPIFKIVKGIPKYNQRSRPYDKRLTPRNIYSSSSESSIDEPMNINLPPLTNKIDLLQDLALSSDSSSDEEPIHTGDTLLLSESNDSIITINSITSSTTTIDYTGEDQLDPADWLIIEEWTEEEY